MADGKAPSYTLVDTTLEEVADLFSRYHAYASTGRVCVYAFAVVENARPVAAFLWQPPPPGASKSVCAECPQGVLALSRMVAVPKEARALRHISKPLRAQMIRRIDRTRWPVLVTYSDESVGHTGHVYKCSGWKKTTRKKVATFTVDGRRVSKYTNGKTRKPEGAIRGDAWIQRWEHWICENPAMLFAAHWRAEDVPGRTWRSGNPRRIYVPA